LGRELLERQKELKHPLGAKATYTYYYIKRGTREGEVQASKTNNGSCHCGKGAKSKKRALGGSMLVPYLRVM